MQNLLFLVHRVPCPPTKGDKVRSSNLLKFLSTRYKVYLGTFVDDPADLAHLNSLRDLCAECHIVRLHPAFATVRSLAGFFCNQPLSLPYYHSVRMHDWVQKTLSEKSISVALTFSAAMAQYLKFSKGVRRVADFVDVDSDKWRQYSITRSWPYSIVYGRECEALLRYERLIAQEFDATVFVSAAEADLFKRLVPEMAENVSCVNNGVDFDYFVPASTYPNPYDSAERVLVFTGSMDYWPNQDAVNWFARTIFPKIYSHDPSVRFCIVGARPTSFVQKLSKLPGVIVTGTVPDIRPYIAHSIFAVAPLRIARGVQNKVLEAMSMAKTVLATSEAAEGIAANIGTELLVATDEAEFVQKALHLLQRRGSPEIGIAGRSRVMASYCWEQNLAPIERLLAGGI